MVQLQPQRQTTLPTMYDLPSEDPKEPGLPDEFHDLQPNLLTLTCRSPKHSREDCFIATDLNLYYDSENTLWHKRPDWFLVLGAKRSRTQDELRLSYVIWQEQVTPFLVVELLSPGTEDEDLGLTEPQADKPPTKWQVYQDILAIPYYVIYDRYENRLRGFSRISGKYEPLELEGGKLWLEELGLGLGLWSGSYEEVEGLWLRFYEGAGNWVPTPMEQADQERQRAESEHQRAESERQRAEAERQRAEAEHQRAEDERQRAEDERQRAEDERQQKEQERQDKELAQASLEEERQKNEALRARLQALGIDPDQLS